jgi:carboxylesterase
MNLEDLELFQAEEHQPFFWKAGRPAALLVHGFPGTPAEMRPLARRLNLAGWTTEGILLPGFGAQIGTLFERHYEEWIDTTREALLTLQEDHQPVLLIGYSMGGAVALSAAAQSPPDGLILVSPFWRIGSRIQRLIWQAVKRVFPTIQPFRNLSLEDPKVRQAVGGFLPDVDLDSPDVQDSLRSVRIPTSLIDEVLATGKAGRRSASQITVPTFIVQGVKDEAVPRAVTRQLLQALETAIRYAEVDTGHELLKEDDPAWAETSRLILEFAGEFVPLEIS